VSLIGTVVGEVALRAGVEGQELWTMRVAVPRVGSGGIREPGVVYVEVTATGLRGRELAEELVEDLAVQGESAGRGSAVGGGGDRQRAEQGELERVEGVRVGDPDQRLDAVQQQVGEPEPGRVKRGQLAPPGQEGAAAGGRDGGGSGHAPLSSRWNVSGWGPCPWR
jgi:hypothetical protein